MLIDDEIIDRGKYDKKESIYTITFGEHVREVGVEAFADCPYLEKVILPASVVVVKEGAFAHCPKLTTVICSSSTRFEEGVFLGCYGFRDLHIDSVDVRLFSFDAQNSFLVTHLDQTFHNSDVQLYRGRFCSARKTFPQVDIKEVPPSVEYMAVINKDGQEYKWFSIDPAVAVSGARFLASGKSFNEYFGLHLSADTVVNYNQLSLIIGTCSQGWTMWRTAFEIIGFDPNKKYSLRFIRQTCQTYVPSVAERIDSMIKHGDEPRYSFLDISKLITWRTAVEQLSAWRDHYLK